MSSDAYLLCWEERRRDPETTALGNELICGTCDRDSSTSSGPEDGGRVVSLVSGLHGTVLSTDDKSVHSQLRQGTVMLLQLLHQNQGLQGQILSGLAPKVYLYELWSKRIGFESKVSDSTDFTVGLSQSLTLSVRQKSYWACLEDSMSQNVIVFLQGLAHIKQRRLRSPLSGGLHDPGVCRSQATGLLSDRLRRVHRRGRQGHIWDQHGMLLTSSGLRPRELRQAPEAGCKQLSAQQVQHPPRRQEEDNLFIS